MLDFLRRTVAVMSLVATACGGQPDPAGERFRHPPGTPWQWQLTGRVDGSVDVPVYDIDGFTATADLVRRLRDGGRTVVCYISAGTFEPSRPDARTFPDAIKGKPLEDFPDERWLDVRRIDVLRPVIESRLEMCRDKGFDAVEPDNLDGYQNDSGFPLERADQLRFNRLVARLAHRRDLAVGLKNDLDNVPALVDHFDFAVNEQCFQYDECEALAPFIDARKPVFNAEYELTPADFCARARAMRISAMRKNLELDAFREPC